VKLIGALIVLAGLGVGGFVLFRGDRGGGEPARGTDTPAPPTPAGPRGTAGLAVTALSDAPARISGTVRDAMTAVEVADATVKFVGAGATDAQSGADGRYSVELAPGSYTVTASGVDLLSMRPITLLVAPGAVITGLDMRVAATASVAGRVVDGRAGGDGEAMADIEVTCVARLSGEIVARDELAPCAARSGEDGRFTLATPPGRVELRAEIEGRPPASVLLRWVEPGAQLSGVELVLDSGARIAGDVVDGDAARVGGARVTAWRNGALVGEATAGEDGAFAIAALPPGTIRVKATAAGFGESMARAVELVAGGEQSVQLMVTAPQRINGRTIDPDGAAVAGARVALYYAGTTVEVGAADSGADGAFEIGSLGRGPYDAVARKDGYAPARRGNIGASLDGLELSLAQGGGVAGTVTANGAPLSDFTVHLLEHVPIGGGVPAEPPAPLRFATPDGSYTIDGVDPGSYTLVVSAPDYAPHTARDVNVPPGAYAQGSAALVGGATVTGQVLNAQTHRPIHGALVSLSTGHRGEADYTDEQGRYTIDDIAPGRRSVAVQRPGFIGRIESAIDLATGDSRAVDFELQPIDSSQVEPVDGEPIELAGIGAAISWRNDRLVVQGVVPGSPAEIAGVAPADEITEIDGFATRGRGLGAGVEDIRGVAGTSVRLRITRKGVDPFQLDIVRATVRYAGQE
jgi:hypothetical protein